MQSVENLSICFKEDVLRLHIDVYSLRAKTDNPRVTKFFIVTESFIT